MEHLGYYEDVTGRHITHLVEENQVFKKQFRFYKDSINNIGGPEGIRTLDFRRLLDSQ